MKHVANEVVLDTQKGTLSIDGLALPYYLAPDPEIEVHPGGIPVGIVRVGLIADNVVLIDKDGRRVPLVTATREAELAWARRRATEIVVAGLADVLTQIKEKQQS